MKHLIISGASQGIGKATAQLFSDGGYTVVNLSRRKCDLEGIQNISCDFSSDSSVKSGLQGLSELIGPEKTNATLIHNAARLVNDSVESTTSEQLREIIEINLVAANTLNHHLISKLNPGSSILYVGSTLGEKAVPNSFSYSISKHALIGMMRATCQDLAGTGIHTACINPGFTNTEMLREHIPQEIMPEIAKMSSFERLIEPQEIAEVLLFAAKNSVINGAVLDSNLGQIER